jgi:hypothetical protein
LLDEELHYLHSSPNIIIMTESRAMRWAGYVAQMREKRNECRRVMEKPEGKRQLGRHRHRWRIVLEYNLEK